MKFTFGLLKIHTVLVLLFISSISGLLISGIGENSGGYEFGTNLLLSTQATWNHHVEPTMALGDNGEIFVGWKQADEPDSGGRAVAYSFSKDNGRSWTDPVDVEDFLPGGYGQSDPWMNYYQGKLYYSYLEFALYSGGISQVTMATTTDFGGTWQKVSASRGTGEFADRDTFTIGDDGTIYLVYADTVFPSLGDPYVILRMSISHDGGATFKETSILNDVYGYDVHAMVAPGEDGKIFAVWSKFNNVSVVDPTKSGLMFDVSTDNGQSFGVDRNLISQRNGTMVYRNPENSRSAIHSVPVIERNNANGRIYVVWDDVSSNPLAPATSWDVYMMYSDSDGETWSQITQVNEISSENQFDPDIEFDSNMNLHVVYFDDSDNLGRQVKHREYFPDSKSWSEESIVTDKPSSKNFTRPGEYMSIRIDNDDDLHVVWSDSCYNELDIFYANTKSEGASRQNSIEMYFPVIFVGLAVLIRRRINT